MAALPWFPFDRIAYITNTMHLTTEEHGAYLLLMLTYYGTGKPLPGYDRALAQITKLPLERWGIVKVGIAPFFEERDGLWYHERIEAELLEASSKHTKAVAKAHAAAAARYGKPATGMQQAEPPASRKRAPRAKPAPSTATSTAPSMPQASPDTSSKDAHLQEHLTLSVERVNAAAPDNSTTEAEMALQGQEGVPAQPSVPPPIEPGRIPSTEQVAAFQNPLGTMLPETWVPDDQDQACAREYGMTDADIKSELLIFHALNTQNGTFSKNWKSTWQIFCSRWKDRQASKRKVPAPRLELDTHAYVPTQQDWERALGRWQRDQSGWSHKTLGPEPGQRACKADPAMLRKFGIDPETGIYRAPAAVRAV